MCILSYLPPGHDVDWDGLFYGGISNPHGHGWAIAVPATPGADDGKIIMGKALDIIEALEQFAKARDRYMDGPALFHSRIATHGDINIGNTHPFFVGTGPDMHKTVVGHNGILSAPAIPLKGDPRSDTRKFAEDILPVKYSRFDKASEMKALRKWAGGWNKLVILTVNPRYRSNAYIINKAAGWWDGATGLWHSNRDFMEPTWAKEPEKEKKEDERPVFAPCLHCDDGLIAKTGFCDRCSRYHSIGEELASKAAVVKSAAESATVFKEQWNCQMCGIGEISRDGYCRACHTCVECYGIEDDDCTCWNRSGTPLRSDSDLDGLGVH